MGRQPGTRDFEEQILADLDDPAPYQVYGDWLQATGDPRGGLIAAQVAQAARPESYELAAVVAGILTAHREALLGPEFDADPTPGVEWSFGFWRSLRWVSPSWSSSPIRADHVARILASDSARFLRVIKLDGPIGRETFAAVASKHRTLESAEITLRGEGVDDACLARLASCHRVQRLALYSCDQVTSDGVAALGQLGQLRSLDLYNHRPSDAAIGHLVGLPLSEVSFNMLSDDFTAIGMQRLAALPLRKLALRGEVLDDECVAALAGHPTLFDLELCSEAITSRVSATLGALAHLRRLDLSGSSLGDGGVRALVASLGDRQAGLRELVLGYCTSLGDASCAAIGEMDGLEVLVLRHNPAISAEGLRALRSHRGLRVLDLAYLDLDDEALRELLVFSGLTDLNLALSRRIGDEGARVLTGLESLQRLDLGCTEITAHGIDLLARMPRLHTIGLVGCAPPVVEHAWTYGHWTVHVKGVMTMTAE